MTVEYTDWENASFVLAFLGLVALWIWSYYKYRGTGGPLHPHFAHDYGCPVCDRLLYSSLHAKTSLTKSGRAWRMECYERLIAHWEKQHGRA